MEPGTGSTPRVHCRWAPQGGVTLWVGATSDPHPPQMPTPPHRAAEAPGQPRSASFHGPMGRAGSVGVGLDGICELGSEEVLAQVLIAMIFKTWCFCELASAWAAVEKTKPGPSRGGTADLPVSLCCGSSEWPVAPPEGCSSLYSRPSPLWLGLWIHVILSRQVLGLLALLGLGIVTFTYRLAQVSPPPACCLPHSEEEPLGSWEAQPQKDSCQ